MNNAIIADLVVYGKIFTSEDNQIVEAFAVKDGKYVYVGDKKGAEAFIEAGKTEVLDYSGKGPGQLDGRGTDRHHAQDQRPQCGGPLTSASPHI